MAKGVHCKRPKRQESFVEWIPFVEISQSTRFKFYLLLKLAYAGALYLVLLPLEHSITFGLCSKITKFVVAKWNFVKDQLQSESINGNIACNNQSPFIFLWENAIVSSSFTRHWLSRFKVRSKTNVDVNECGKMLMTLITVARYWRASHFVRQKIIPKRNLNTKIMNSQSNDFAVSRSQSSADGTIISPVINSCPMRHYDFAISWINDETMRRNSVLECVWLSQHMSFIMQLMYQQSMTHMHATQHALWPTLDKTEISAK